MRRLFCSNVFEDSIKTRTKTSNRYAVRERARDIEREKEREQPFVGAILTPK